MMTKVVATKDDLDLVEIVGSFMGYRVLRGTMKYLLAREPDIRKLTVTQMVWVGGLQMHSQLSCCSSC